MPKKTAFPSRKHLRVRLDPISVEYADARVKDGRFRSMSAYLQHLVWKERTGADGPMAQLEEKISKTIAGLQEDVRDVRVSAEGANAFLHALAKMLIVTLHDPEGEEKTQLRATAAKRYERLVTVAGKELALLLEGEEPDGEPR